MWDTNDLRVVLKQAEDAGWIDEDQSAQLTGLFIARTMVNDHKIRPFPARDGSRDGFQNRQQDG